MNSIFYVTNSALTSVNNNDGQFTPTVLLTDQVKAAVRDGTVTLRKGQWVIDGKTGQRAQYAGLKKSALGGTKMVGRSFQAGKPFTYYQTKLAA